MNKTLTVGLALAVVTFLALVHEDLTSSSARVDAQQNPRAAANRNRVVALLHVDDLEAGFTEVKGLGSVSEVVEYREGSDPSQKVRKIPGRLKWRDITLKRGLTGNMDLWKWRKVIEDGGTDFRKDGRLILLNANREPIAQWEFNAAWPSKISGPMLKSDGNDIPMEEMVLTHEGIRRVQ